MPETKPTDSSWERLEVRSLCYTPALPLHGHVFLLVSRQHPQGCSQCALVTFVLQHFWQDFSFEVSTGKEKRQR